MEPLKTNYKNDKFTGMRRYQKIDNEDGTISLNDVTTYAEVGDIYSADDINVTNKGINNLIELRTITLLVDNWNSTAPYIQMVNVPSMKSTDIPDLGVIYPESITESLKVQIDKSTNMITKFETLDGAVKVTCKFRKPVADMTISLKGV